MFWAAGDGAADVAARGQRGADLRYDMSLTFEEAATGVNTKIHICAARKLRGLQRHGRETGNGNVRLRHLRRARADVLLSRDFFRSRGLARRAKARGK